VVVAVAVAVAVAWEWEGQMFHRFGEKTVVRVSQHATLSPLQSSEQRHPDWTVQKQLSCQSLFLETVQRIAPAATAGLGDSNFPVDDAFLFFFEK
jgi:hypothetical protein